MAKPDCLSQILNLTLAGWMSLSNTLDCSEPLFPHLLSGDVDNNAPHGTVVRLKLVIHTERLEFARCDVYRYWTLLASTTSAACNS